MRRTLTIVVAGLAAVALAAPAGALPNCSSVATFQACNAHCGLYGSSCFRVDYNDDPFGESCEFRYTCDGSGSTGWSPCNCGGPVGCMVPGTQILLEDGSVTPVEEIRVGDRVLAYDEVSGAVEADDVSAVHDPVEWSYYHVINGDLRLTPSHRVLSNGTWLQAVELRPGDVLTRADGTTVTVERLEVVEEPVTVHNFATDSHHTYVANGYIIHNKPPIPKEEEPDHGGE